MIEFQVRRVLADADLDTPAGRDKALEEARKLISAVPERTATRDALVREAADRLDVPVDYVLAPCARGRRGAGATPRLQASAGELALRAEREFLIRCLSSGELGHDYLARPDDEQFSSDAHPPRPRRTSSATSTTRWPTLPQDDPGLGGAGHGRRLRGAGAPAHRGAVLRMSLLQLEQRRIEREISARVAGRRPRPADASWPRPSSRCARSWAP